VKVEAALQKLAKSDEGDIKRLANVKSPEWRLRVGEVRVRFAYVQEDDAIVVLRVLPRGKVYDR
jgi:mRNA-degrading endonuclease RelE of RelBE toxin-antitoxin system